MNHVQGFSSELPGGVANVCLENILMTGVGLMFYLIPGPYYPFSTFLAIPHNVSYFPHVFSIRHMLSSCPVFSLSPM